MTSALCIALLFGSSIRVLPTDHMTLRWVHTVEKRPWEEDYRVSGGGLRIDEARVKTSGAGMDPPRDAIWKAGWWRYRPTTGVLPELVLANSEYAPGYTLCWADTCRLLSEFVSVGTFVRIASRACPPQHHDRKETVHD